jgi:hypothetical protein
MVIIEQYFTSMHMDILVCLPIVVARDQQAVSLIIIIILASRLSGVE